MEAEYIGDRRRRRVVVVGGALLAVLAALGTYYLATRPSTGPSPVQQRTIVVAAVAIEERTLIEASMLRTETAPDTPALRQAVTDPATVEGNVAQIDIAAGVPIIAGMYGPGTAGGLDILPAGEIVTPDSPAWRAVSVQIPEERAVGGLVQSGDHVDLFATIEIKIYDATGELSENALPPEGYYSDSTTKVTWTNLEVLSSDADNSLYVLRVEEHQAEEIAHVQGSGANSFTMSLRAEADARELDRSSYGETTNRILEQYNYPIPQIIDLGNYPQPSPQPPLP